MFFWVFPRRQIEFCLRFGTLCQAHLQRLDEEYELHQFPRYRTVCVQKAIIYQLNFSVFMFVTRISRDI
jgi:hypothetical protein